MALVVSMVKKMIKEFKEFAQRGNVVDLAVGLMLGTAFGAIVQSLVRDVLMPPIGLVFGGGDLKDRFFVLRGGSYDTLEEAQAAEAVTLNWGQFLATMVDFLIIAWALFFVVKQVNRVRAKQVTGPEPTPAKDCPYCTSKIPVAARRCPFCTADLEAASPSAAPA